MRTLDDTKDETINGVEVSVSLIPVKGNRTEVRLSGYKFGEHRGYICRKIMKEESIGSILAGFKKKLEVDVQTCQAMIEYIERKEKDG
jgi:hypothetical protein